MIRFARKEDRFAMADLVLVILKDMELPFVKEIGEAKTLEILADAMLEPSYCYGYTRALVNEIDGAVAVLRLVIQIKKRRRSINHWIVC